MNNKVKISYLLLGIGIGIILSNIIFVLNPIVKYKEYSNQQIIEEAEELGMVFVKQNISIDDKIDQNKSMKFTIEKHDNLVNISNRLFKMKIINDKDEFIEYVKNKKMQCKLVPGTYELKQGMSYGDVLKILVKMK